MRRLFTLTSKRGFYLSGHSHMTSGCAPAVLSVDGLQGGTSMDAQSNLDLENFKTMWTL